jgi:uncharacterized protein (DUF4415 family)
VTRALVLRRRRPGRKIGEAVREMQERLEAAGWKVDSLVVKAGTARGDGWQRRGDDAHHRVDPTAALTVIVPIR